jgi:uncharacterized membrane protein
LTLLIAILQGLGLPRFPSDMLATEQIALRWTHITAAIIWIGLLYFFNLVGTPTMKELDPGVRSKLFPVLMRRAMWWFRWSALITVLAGVRYFWEMLVVDAANDGSPMLAWRWLGEWFAVWLVAYALIYPLQMPRKGLLDNPWVRAVGIGGITLLAMLVVLDLNANVPVSNNHLAIAAGGGLGLLMLLNTWGVVWRAQKRLIFWTSENIERGTAIPEKAAYLARWSFIASRTGFWMSFPLIFFMAAAGHYPFLYSISN